MTGNLSEAAVVSLPCLDVPRSETKLATDSAMQYWFVWTSELCIDAKQMSGSTACAAWSNIIILISDIVGACSACIA